MTIQSFGDEATEDIFNGVSSKATRKFPAAIIETAHRKLDMINAAAVIGDLNTPPGNRLEKLKGKLADFYSIRVNDQFRIIFRFDSGKADAVQLIDYH